MKYFKVFNTENEYLEYIHSEGCITPYVITLRDSSNTWISEEIHDYSKDYFTIESLEDNNEIKIGRSTGGGVITELHIAASTDDGVTWTEYALPYGDEQYEIATINSGDKIMFKYISGGFSRALNTSTYFTTSGNFNVYGNAMSLVKADDFTTGTTSTNLNRLLYGSKVVSAENLILQPRFSNNNDLFAGMFSGCTNLTTPPLVLPETTLGSRSYNDMFNGCTSLETAPVISATTLGNQCCQGMFQGCISLTAAPSLPATTMGSSAYTYMFSGCTSLTEAPELPATTLADSCYRGMFDTCTSLTTAPELPARTLASQCYRAMFANCSNLTTAPSSIGDSSTTMAASACTYMFDNCTSLTIAPSLPATTLADSCYQTMFHNCTSLTTAPELPATTLADGCYSSMFNTCTSLTTVPEILPATTLSNQCYMAMFSGCTSLTTAPELPAPTIESQSYRWMFNNCSSLNYIKMLAEDGITGGNLWNWVSNVSPTGTFVKHVGVSIGSGTSGIPNGWTVEEYSDVHATGVTISPTAETITKGNTVTLTATVSPNDAYDKSVTWATSDSTVATVANGVVTAVGCGQATITVTTHDGGYTAQCATSVVNPVTGITLNSNIAYIITGNTYQLEATLTPADACGDKSVTWASSNNSVATVSNNGLVTAVALGNATITATTTVGSHTATCAVEVTEPVAVTSVTLNTGSTTISEGETYQLTATVLPSNATDKTVTWSSSNNNVATVDSNGLVTAIGSGSTNITVTTHDGGLTAQCAVTVEVNYSLKYFTIESLQDSNTITAVKSSSSKSPVIYYSLDDGQTWSNQTLASGTITFGTINTGEKIIFKCQISNWASDWNKYNRFNGSKQFKVYGNAMSLLNGDDFKNNSEFATGSSYNLCGLFYGTTTVVDASDLILPATTLMVSSYNGMFRGCKALQYGPKLLPALVVPQDGYSSMFESGTSLVEAPEIMATTVSGNTALNRMFCMARSGKVSAALTKGPVLRITNPSAYSNCYQQLFAGNSNITEVTILAEGTNLSFANWLNNVSSSGVIKKLSATTLTNNSVNGKPSGWTYENID